MKIHAWCKISLEDLSQVCFIFYKTFKYRKQNKVSFILNLPQGLFQASPPSLSKNPNTDGYESRYRWIISHSVPSCRKEGGFHLFHDCLWMIERGEACRDMLIVFAFSKALTARPSQYLNPVYPSDAGTASLLIVNLLIVRRPWASK